jgi:hypothetical protein
LPGRRHIFIEALHDATIARVERSRDVPVVASNVNDQASFDVGRVQYLLRRLFPVGRGAEHTDHQQQPGNQAQPTPRHVSAPGACCIPSNQLHVPNLVLIIVGLNATYSQLRNPTLCRRLHDSLSNLDVLSCR